MANANLRKIKSGFIKTTDRHQNGVACVASVIKHFGGSAELQQLQKSSGAAKNGVSLFGLCKAARVEGFAANGFKANVDALKGVNTPVILHVSKDSGDEDFVVVYGWNKKRFIVGDPQWGIIEYREDELEAIWKSNSLMLMEPDEVFQTTNEKRKLKHLGLLKLFKNYKKVLLTTAILGIAGASLLVLTLSVFLYKVINVFNNKQFLFESVLLLAVFLIFIVVIHFKNVFVLQGEKNLRLDLITRISKNIFNRNFDPNDSSGSNTIMLEKAVKDFSNYVFKIFGTVPFYTILYFISIIYISLKSVWAGIIIFSGMAFSFLITWVIQKKTEHLNDSENNSFTERVKILNFSSQFIRNIKLVNGEKGFVSKNTDNLRSLLETKLSIALFKDQNNNWLFLLFFLLVIILFGFVFELQEERSQVVWLALGCWLTVSFFSVFRLSKLLVEFNSARTSYNIIYNRIGVELLDNGEVGIKKERSVMGTIKTLSVENLDFAFPGQAPLFKGVNINAKLGDITVVNGATGSGKSVLVSLLARLIPLQNGLVKINGLDWNTISDFDWNENISAIVQPIQLYNCSVLENIGRSKKVVESSQVITFCKKMGFDNFISSFPNGYATESNNLSAGQQQFISLAMVLYRSPKLLLLDVPFVFMDEEMTNFSMELIRKLKNEILIVIFNCSNKVKTKADTFFVYKMGNYIS